MSDISNKLVVITITRDEARIWATGLDKGSRPEKIFAPAEKGSFHHLRQTLHQSGHSDDPADWGYFDLIANEVKDASEILLIGHGEGKANAVLRFVQFVERNNPVVAKKIVGAIDTNLFSMTENQILASAREWFDQYNRSHLAT